MQRVTKPKKHWQKWGDGMDLISREALIGKFTNGCCGVCDICPHELSDEDGVCALIANAPTIEAVPVVHAEWKMRGGKLYCTNCGKKALAEKDRDDWYGCAKSDFCPNCGADMRKKV